MTQFLSAAPESVLQPDVLELRDFARRVQEVRSQDLDAGRGFRYTQVPGGWAGGIGFDDVEARIAIAESVRDTLNAVTGGRNWTVAEGNNGDLWVGPNDDWRPAGSVGTHL